MLITSANITFGDMKITINDLYNLHKSNILTEHPHMHSDAEFHFILNGNSTMVFNDKTYQLRKNRVLLVPRNVTHYSSYCSPDYITLAFSFSLSRDKSKKNTGEYNYYSSILNTDKVTLIKLKPEDRLYVNTLIENLNSHNMSSLHKLNSLITLLFIDIGREISQITKNNDPIITSFPYSDITARKLLTESFIYERINHNISLAELSEYLSLSRRQTIRFIRQEFGYSFSELITRACMIEAKNLIKKGDKRITQIARDLGYQNYATFYSAYKKYYGITPQQTLESIEKE